MGREHAFFVVLVQAISNIQENNWKHNLASQISVILECFNKNYGDTDQARNQLHGCEKHSSICYVKTHDVHAAHILFCFFQETCALILTVVSQSFFCNKSEKSYI
jgi:hypothetical protein